MSEFGAWLAVIFILFVVFFGESFAIFLNGACQ